MKNPLTRCFVRGCVGIAPAVRAVGQPTAAGYARRPPARAFGAGLSPSAQLAHVCVCGAMMAVESRWWSGITRYANGRSAGSRDPLAIRSPRLSRHKKKGSSALIPSSLGYQLCGYRHCLSQERNTAGAVGTQPVGFRKSEASSAVGMSKEESKDFVWDGNEAQFAAADKMQVLIRPAVKR